jgi:glutathione S-transferase
VKLYQYPSSPHCLKVRAVAYELGLELELVTVNLFGSASRQRSELEALNPNGLVPVLVDGDFVLWESNAILTYLAGTHRRPALIPTDARGRADVERWLHWQSAHLAPAISRVVFERFIKPMTGQAPVDHAAAAAAASDFKRHCRVLEESLRDMEYIARRLSVADFALACVVDSAAMVGLGVDTFPRTRTWLRRMVARDSVRRALAEARLSTSEMVPCGAR